MTIEEMKKRKIELGYTSEMISKESGVPLGTVQKIFAGTTKAPRRRTIEALERVLRYNEMISRMKDPDRYGYDAKNTPETQEADVVREQLFEYGTSPKDRIYTLDDYYALPDDMRVELIDGVFYDMAAPGSLHQLILGQLFRSFSDCAEDHDMPCEVMMAPFDVRLDRDNYTMVQPDLLVICSEQDYLHMKRLEGAPDLAVEILSPSTRSKDMILKLHKYKNAGVREYWIVDPKNLAVTVHFFEDEENYDPKKYSFDDQIPVTISGGTCSIDFSQIRKKLSQYGDLSS